VVVNVAAHSVRADSEKGQRGTKNPKRKEGIRTEKKKKKLIREEQRLTNILIVLLSPLSYQRNTRFPIRNDPSFLPLHRGSPINFCHTREPNPYHKSIGFLFAG
jgi:hypothetical protein